LSTVQHGKSQMLAAAAEQLVHAGRRFDQRGWVMGTSGNFSVVIDRDPLRLAITSSATFKGELGTDQILEMDERGAPIGAGQSQRSRGPTPARSRAATSRRARAAGARASAEALLHLEIVRVRGAGAVLHTHSIWSTLLSERFAEARGVLIEGYEMLKGLEGIRTHEHREWLPIVDNDQDMTRLSGVVRGVLDGHPDAHGFLLRRHGLYTWGADLPQAVRHIEILEFLMEVVGRSSQPSAVSHQLGSGS
jgi:methylthioribulose-1-phosphate dehydratase